MRPNDIENELTNALNMMNYFGENFDRLPAVVQLNFITELLKMSEKLKPLYISALAICGDLGKNKEEEKDD